MGLATTLAAVLWVMWGVLHIWVGGEGFRQYADRHRDPYAQINFMDGPAAKGFMKPNDKTTQYVLQQFVLNFTTDVGGYGVLGLVVAYMIYFNASPWIAFFMGFIVIGIADLAFLFFSVLAGVIPLYFEVILGPLVWFLAVIVTPIGLLQDGRNSSKKNKRA
jgi:hypothetical protein